MCCNSKLKSKFYLDLSEELILYAFQIKEASVPKNERPAAKFFL